MKVMDKVTGSLLQIFKYRTPHVGRERESRKAPQKPDGMWVRSYSGTRCFGHGSILVRSSGRSMWFPNSWFMREEEDHRWFESANIEMGLCWSPHSLQKAMEISDDSSSTITNTDFPTKQLMSQPFIDGAVESILSSFRVIRLLTKHQTASSST